MFHYIKGAPKLCKYNFLGIKVAQRRDKWTPQEHHPSERLSFYDSKNSSIHMKCMWLKTVLKL